MAESIYKLDAQARTKNQEKIHNKIKEKNKFEKINLSIPAEYKEKLQKYCDKNYISISALLRSWIDMHCNDT